MSVRYEWADEEKFIITVYVEYPWTWQEYLETAQRLKALIDSSDSPCATIVEATHYGSLPKDGNTIQMLLGIDKLLSENIFASAIVGAPYGVIVFLNMMMKLRPRMQRIAIFSDTMEEAHAEILERYRQWQSDNPESRF